MTDQTLTVAAAPTDNLYRSIQAAAICLSLILAAGILHLGEAGYVAFALTGGFLVHLMIVRPGAGETAATILAGAGFAAIYLLLHGPLGSFIGRNIAVTGAFLGMGSIAVLAVKWIWALPDQRQSRGAELCDTGLIPLLCAVSMIAVGLAIALTPNTYDRTLYIFDAKFGDPPSWVIGELFRAHPALRTVCGFAYNTLPLAMCACVVLEWRNRVQGVFERIDLRWVAVALGVTGFFLYQVCPAAGPVYLFRSQFPGRIPNLAAVAAGPAWLEAVPRNGMPSLHVGWMMLLFWNLRRNAWWMAVGSAVYLMLTALATLGLGEHYLSDLIVAAPVALVIQAGCTRIESPARWISLSLGAAITLVWLVGLRTGALLAIPGGAPVWALSALTLAIPLIAAWYLDRARMAYRP